MKLKIFEAGDYPQGKWSAKRLKALVDNYDPVDGIEAPCVIGHKYWTGDNESELAHGWVRKIWLRGKELWADIEVLADLAGYLAAKQLRYVSVEMRAGSEGDYETDPPQLLRVAFLGHSIPQIKTTRVEEFESGEEEVVTFAHKLPEQKRSLFQRKPEQSDQSKSDQSKKGEKMSETPEETYSSKQYQELQKERDEFKKQLDEQKAAQAQADVTTKIDSFCFAGKLPPAEKESAIKIALALQGAEREAYFKQLESRSPVVEAKTVAESGHSQGAGVSALTQVQQYATKNNLSFEQAVMALQAENPQLIAQLKGGNNG